MVTKEENNVVAEGSPVAKKKKSWLNILLHFLMYGGWILVIVIVLGIFIAIQC